MSKEKTYGTLRNFLSEMTDKIICITKLPANIKRIHVNDNIKILRKHKSSRDVNIFIEHKVRKRQISKTRHRIMKENTIA